MRLARTSTLLIYALLSTLLVSTPAWAKPRHQHHSGFCYFGDKDVEVLGTYYAPQVRKLPPGLAKKYARTGKLPSGWDKKMQPIPVAVEQQLAPIPAGYRRGFVDGFVVVYNPQTGLMIDTVALFGS
jgi:hypothetical protein